MSVIARLILSSTVGESSGAESFPRDEVGRCPSGNTHKEVWLHLPSKRFPSKTEGKPPR